MANDSPPLASTLNLSLSPASDSAASDRIQHRKSDASLIRRVSSATQQRIVSELESFSSVELPPYRVASGATNTSTASARRRRARSDPERIVSREQPMATMAGLGEKSKVDRKDWGMPATAPAPVQPKDAQGREVSQETPLYETAVVLDESTVRRLTELNDVDLSFQDSEMIVPEEVDSDGGSVVRKDPPSEANAPSEGQFNLADYTVDLDAWNQSTCGGRNQFAMHSSSEANLVVPQRHRPRANSVDSGPSDFTADLVNYMKGTRNMESKPSKGPVPRMVSAATSESTELGAVIQDLTSENKSLRSKNTEFEERNLEFSAKLGHVLHENKRLGEMVRGLEQEMLALKQARSSPKHSTPVITTDVDFYEAKTLELTQANDLLTKSLDGATHRAGYLESHADDVQTLNNDLAKEKRELTSQVEHLSKRVEDLMQSNETLESSRADIKARAEAFESQVDNLTKHTEELNFSSNALTIQNQTLEATVTKLTAQNEQLSNDNEEIAADATALETQVAQQKNEIRDLQHELSTHGHSADQLAFLTTQVRMLREGNEELKAAAAAERRNQKQQQSSSTDSGPAIDPALRQRMEHLAQTNRGLLAAKKGLQVRADALAGQLRDALVERDHAAARAAQNAGPLLAAKEQLARDLAAARVENAAVVARRDKERAAWADERLALLEQMDAMRHFANRLGKRMLWEWGKAEVGPLALPVALPLPMGGSEEARDAATTTATHGQVRRGMGYRYQTMTREAARA